MTTLEKIRAEILNHFLWDGEDEKNLNTAVRKCLEIIDRYVDQQKYATIEKIAEEIAEEVNKHYEEWSFVAGLMTAKDIFEKYADEECDRDCEHCVYLECPKGGE